MKKESLNSKGMELGCFSEVIVNNFGPTSEKKLYTHTHTKPTKIVAMGMLCFNSDSLKKPQRGHAANLLCTHFCAYY